jgi:hypothetical protein
MVISALYVRTDSVYKTLGVDCWDIDRDARNWPGGNPVIAHPPCRAWGKLHRFANPRPGEKELAIDAVNSVRKWGGVLEHPSGSHLWKEMNLPLPGKYDEYGGFTLNVNQSWWGHKAEKKTLLYIVGMKVEDVPRMPISFDAIQYTISSPKKVNGRRNQHKKEISKKEREETPIDFAKWLIELASNCKVS